ncbi:hypothetical protein TMRO357_02745 [Alteriqipengyuania sp. 357]
MNDKFPRAFADPAGGFPSAPKVLRSAPTPAAYMLRAITIFMISFDPPKMRVIRLSRNMRAIG